MTVSDRQKMIEFISSQMPNGEARLVLAHGTIPGDDIIADVTVYGDDLDIQSNCPEWVDVREIYDHLHWQSRPSWEQEAWLRSEAAKGRLIAFEKRLANYDAIHKLAPYRFQKLGKMWVVHFTAADAFEMGHFNDHRGFQHYARLLANPDRRILSLDLAGRLDLIASGIGAAENAFSRMTQHTPEAIKTYHKALDRLKDDHEGARQRGDIGEMESVSDRIDQLESLLWGEGKKTFTRLRRQKIGGRSIPQKIHSSVGQAMRRAVAEMLDNPNASMRNCAAFLERYVEPPDGEAFIYRPPSLGPNWLL